ncbi:CvpA family protein [Granulosicoccus antarcticus]|uniref:Colicin V production protein n=1 Tax=Granulosicoccus antarcticus IMCC3135 TaxID=1192854 RepID=A0A2Z2NZW3_9GAMM|nr:CvpA family protein [Granulosicoccus antarcticus]ASJ75328.1 Colicin V production protein [Granulosicoccus antarcticus IMCC3135]
MSEVDLVILGIFALSALISLMRGFFREAMSLSIWLGAVIITLVYTSRFASLLPIDRVDSQQARTTISALVLFAGTLFVGNLINWMLNRIKTRKSLSPTDRIIGVAFGLLRGFVIVTLLVLAANLAPELKQEPWWESSTFLPKFQEVTQVVHARLPDSIGQHFDFPPTSY